MFLRNTYRSAFSLVRASGGGVFNKGATVRFFSSSDEVEVCFLDPLEVTQPVKPEGTSSMVKLKVPRDFLNEVRHGRELPLPSQAGTYGDKDKMVNAWVFGQQVGAFEYLFIGSHRSKSGFTCAIQARDLQELKKTQLEGDTKTSNKYHGVHMKPEFFDELRRRYQKAGPEKASLEPFLFFAKVEGSEKASGVHVYAIRSPPAEADVPNASATGSGDGPASTAMGGAMSMPDKVPGARISGIMLNQSDRMTMGEY